MPPIRTLSTTKPVRYERTHEENQERAYIAASRRSDRGIEARMESARRASAIHEKRTGRALRITEEDVINEEMYEEINDLPTEYRRLNAHLHTHSAEFDRRLLAYLSCQMAARQAVSDCWQNDPSNFDNRGSNFNTPQEPSPHRLSASPTSGGIIDYRHSPYPFTTQDIAWRQQGHPASTYVSGFDQQYPQSMFSSPPFRDRHMSLPSHSTIPPPCPATGVPMNSLNTDNMSRVDSAVDMAGSPQHLQRSFLHHVHVPKFCDQSPQAPNGCPVEPLSTTLPLDGQQLFTSGPQAFNSQQHMGSPSQNFSYRRYSYNPNGKQKVATSSLPQLQSNYFTAPTNPSQASPSPSSSRSDMAYAPRLSKSYGGVLSQACHDAGGVGPNGFFTSNALEETRDATALGKSTP